MKTSLVQIDVGLSCNMKTIQGKINQKTVVLYCVSYHKSYVVKFDVTNITRSNDMSL